jgi:hypothetical protein
MKDTKNIKRGDNKIKDRKPVVQPKTPNLFHPSSSAFIRSSIPPVIRKLKNLDKAWGPAQYADDFVLMPKKLKGKSWNI